MKNNKFVAVLSTAALATLISAAVTSPASAKTTAFVVKDASSKLVQYDYTELTNSAEDKVVGLDAPLYEDYMKNTGVVALVDDKTGNVDYNAAKVAYEDAVVAKTPFDINTFTENAKGDSIVKITDTITKLTVKDGKVVENGTVTPTPTQLSVSSVTAITDSKLSVKLSSAVDDAAATNFSIEGVTINSATLSADKKEVILDAAGLQVEKSYVLKTTGLKVSGVVQKDLTTDFKMPPATSLFSPSVTFADNTTYLKADGAHSVLVTFTLKDSNGNILKDADKVEVAFSTTFGNFAEKRVTVQNGVATVMLTSESLDSDKTAVITAQVVEAANKNLIGLQKQANMLMTPNPDIMTNQGALMTEAEADQADRVVMYFNQDVKVDDYAVTGTHSVDPKKAQIKVTSNVQNDLTGGYDVPVVGLLPVQGNSKALYAILDTEGGKYLTDNANVKVDFNDSTKDVTVPSTKVFKLTDARKPAMLSVAPEGLNKLKVTFSEPVDKSSAEDESNWLIDGLNLNDAAYGINVQNALVAQGAATAEIGKFDQTTGTDTRNVVTITLGKDKNGNQIYFKPGDHSVQASSIGDWANLTDKGNNVMNTQTLDFSIPLDDKEPQANVDVQSPEQYVVQFNKELNEGSPVIKLQKQNKDNSQWVDVPDTTQDIKVTNASPIGSTNTTFKVEVKNDWTKVYNTSSTHLNYYNDSYRLVIAKGAVSSASNGVKNSADISLPLYGAMLNPDNVSPKIVDNGITEELGTDNKPTGSYLVTLSEPVKFSTNGTTSQDELDTRAQGQDTLPIVKAQFIKKDNSKTIDATIVGTVDKFDKVLKVAPNTKLDNGEWTLVVRSISDDIGNTVASATQDFTVNNVSPDSKFAVEWAFADVDHDLKVEDNDAEDADADHDYVFVKFNKAESITGDAKNALKTSNYLLDGSPLPTGTQIRANIAGYDDKDSVNDSVTIVLPKDYLNHKNAPHVLTISSYLESTTAGDKLTNGGEKKLAWNISTTDGLVSSMAQTLVGKDNATVDGTTVTVINKDAKLVDLLTVSNISTTNLKDVTLLAPTGPVTLYAPTMTPDQVKAAVGTALGKSADDVKLSDLIGKSIGVNGTAYTVK